MEARENKMKTYLRMTILPLFSQFSHKKLFFLALLQLTDYIYSPSKV